MFKQAPRIESEVADGIGEALDALRWCRKHLHDRATGEYLRTARASLAGLAIALDLEMEGEPAMARSALLRTRSRFGWDTDDPSMPPGC